MKSSVHQRVLQATFILLALLVGAPAMAAHPGSLWGIDISSVVAFRDQARAIAHRHEVEQRRAKPDGETLLEAPPLQRVRTLVIDPGHGGDNSGAIGVAEVMEKYLTMELAYALREELQQKYPQLRVVMTRYWDTPVDFSDRVHIANLADADLFLSLHYNAATHDRAIGFETYFLRPEEVTPGQEDVRGEMIASVDRFATGIDHSVEGAAPHGYRGDVLRLIQQDLLRAHQHRLSGRLAEVVQSSLRHHLDSIDRGVKQANFSVLRGAHMPAVLVEAGFLTHPEEGTRATTRDHRHLLVQSLVEAIETFDLELARLVEAETTDAAPSADATVPPS